METDWDNWIRSGMDQLRHEGGAKWQERFVHCPIWFFMCPTSMHGVLAAGAIAPSIDRVGRYYPITVMAFSPPQAKGFANDAEVGRFFSGVRSAVIDARRIPLTVEQMEERIAQLGSPFECGAPQDSLIVDILSDLEAAGVQSTDTSVSLPGLDWRSLFTAGANTSVWWVSPMAQFRHELAVHHGPLHRPLYARLFKGSAT
jgi:type VI secretion system protein ImpM